jgi:hypothetical protein
MKPTPGREVDAFVRDCERLVPPALREPLTLQERMIIQFYVKMLASRFTVKA